jgi:hypothetical protein
MPTQQLFSAHGPLQVSKRARKKARIAERRARMRARRALRKARADAKRAQRRRTRQLQSQGYPQAQAEAYASQEYEELYAEYSATGIGPEDYNPAGATQVVNAGEEIDLLPCEEDPDCDGYLGGEGEEDEEEGMAEIIAGVPNLALAGVAAIAAYFFLK